MIKDFSFGTILYIIVSVLFGYHFDASFYALALCLSLLPDIDFIPYLLFKKRFSLVTHHIIHYPLFFLLLGIIIFALTQNAYLATLFLAILTSHFILDTFATTEYPTGIRWIYPFSKKSWYFSQGAIYTLTEAQQREQLEKRRSLWTARQEKRTLIREVLMRMDAPTPLSMILATFAIVALAVFILK